MARRKKNQHQVDTSATTVTRSRAPLWPLLGVAVGLGIGTLLCYWPALDGGLLWDDDGHVTRPELRSIGGLYRIWFDVGATQQYYPLLHSAFWLEHRLWGDNVLGYHLVNIVLHVVSATLVYAILVRLRVPGAFLAAAIFALHPVHVESVAWITEQKNTLSAVFFLGALFSYLHFDETRHQTNYWLALSLFVLGLLTKTVTATLPAVLLVIFWWQRGTLSWQRDFRPLIPFFLLGAVAGLFTAWVERSLIGADGIEFEMSFVERSLLAGRVPWFYLSKLVWPANLTFIYPRWNIDSTVWWQWLFPLAAIGFLVLLWTLRHRWRAPLAGWLLFVGTLFPVLGFLNVYPFKFSFVADHFQYLPSLGIITVAAAGAALATAKWPDSRQRVAWLAGVLLVSSLGYLTWRQAHLYADQFTLYQATIERNPQCWLAYNNLGWAHAQANRPAEAIAYYQQAIQLQPEYADTYCHLGTAMIVLGRADEGIANIRRAIALRPSYGEAYNNLGSALKLLGKPEESLANYEQAARYLPRNAYAQFNYADALLDRGRSQEALPYFKRAIDWQPDNPESRRRYAQALLDAGEPARAADQATIALRLAPKDVAAHNICGAAMGQLGRFGEAVEHFEAVLRLAPSLAQARTNLMYAYAELGQRELAIENGQRAARQARDNGEIALADRIESWLANYRSQPPASPANPDSL